MYFKINRATKRFVFCGGFIYLFCSYIFICFQLDSVVRERVWHKVLLKGYSMRLELSHVCKLNGFQLVIGFFMKVTPFFLRMCFSWSTLPLIYF